MHVLIIGSGPNAVDAAHWPRADNLQIVAMNNAWRVRPDYDFHVFPEDFPKERRPPPDARGVEADKFVPSNSRYGGIFFAGATMAFTTAYWVLDALAPEAMFFIGCDMVYPKTGATHFYGTGAPDPLRSDPTLRSLEGKAARLMLLAARQRCAVYNCSMSDSRLVFPRSGLAGETSPATLSTGLEQRMATLLSREAGFGVKDDDGRYWERDQPISTADIDRLDADWLSLGETYLSERDPLKGARAP